jgi:eukaryotic-like serine/threonine-protein kinase
VLLHNNRSALLFCYEHRAAHPRQPQTSQAHLEVGRTYAIVDDTVKSKAAYQDFFALWKDADPDIPLLKQAKAESEKLK